MSQSEIYVSCCLVSWLQLNVVTSYNSSNDYFSCSGWTCLTEQARNINMSWTFFMFGDIYKKILVSHRPDVYSVSDILSTFRFNILTRRKSSLLKMHDG